MEITIETSYVILYVQKLPTHNHLFTLLIFMIKIS